MADKVKQFVAEDAQRPQKGTIQAEIGINQPQEGHLAPAMLTPEHQTNPTRTRHTRAAKAAVLLALRKARGVVSFATQLSAIDRSTHYNWVKSDKNYAEKVEAIKIECRRERVDMALALVLEKIANKEDKDSFAAAKLVLENEGQEYGYGLKPGMAVQVNSHVNSGPDITIEQFKAMARKAVGLDKDS